MRHRIQPLAIFLIAGCAHLAGLAAPNHPQNAWRCADNSYSDRPCPGGKAIDVADPRSDADRRAADAATRRDRTAADALERERLKREAAARRDSRAIVIGKQTPPEPAAARHAAKQARPKHGGKAPAELFTAHDPTAEPRSKKSKRK